MAGLKDFLIVMLALVGTAGGLEGEEDNLAMESMRGSVDDDYDFAAFLAKAGEVLGDPGHLAPSSHEKVQILSKGAPDFRSFFE